MSISEEKVKELMVAFSPDGSGGELNLNEFDEMIDEFVQYKFSPDFFSGVPSTVGFASGEFNRLSNWSTATYSNRPIVAEYKPDDIWLWGRWDGSIKQMTWKTSSSIILWAFVVNLFVYHHYISDVAIGNDIAWYASEIRHMNQSDPWIEVFDSIAIFWDQSLSLGIFTLSFFVNQAYEYWKEYIIVQEQFKAG